ncbi:MAG: 30S ribosomal protein S3ae [Candidatus Helarchaeota archaeon]
MSQSKKGSTEKKKRAGQKEFYSLISPKNFNEMEIGMTPASTPEQVIGRVIEISLTDITNDISLMHIKLKFKVHQVVGNNAYTRFIGSDLTRDYLRSLVRRLTTRVDGIYNIMTSDGYKLRITSLVFTESRITHRQKYTIRKIMKGILEGEASSLKFDDYILDLVYGKISEIIYRESKRIVPIRKTEILKIKVLSEPNTS